MSIVSKVEQQHWGYSADKGAARVDDGLPIMLPEFAVCRSWDFMTCLRLGEVFLAATSAFWGQERFTRSFGYFSGSGGAWTEDSRKRPAFTNGFGFGYSQFLIPSINPQ